MLPPTTRAWATNRLAAPDTISWGEGVTCGSAPDLMKFQSTGQALQLSNRVKAASTAKAIPAQRAAFCQDISPKAEINRVGMNRKTMVSGANASPLVAGQVLAS